MNLPRLWAAIQSEPNVFLRAAFFVALLLELDAMKC